MCIDCEDNSIPLGPTGDDGAQGGFGGFSGEWVFDTSTSTGPGATLLRLNNATYGSVTKIYVSDNDVNLTNFDTFLDSFSNNSKFGLVRIFKKDDSSIFWAGQITAVVDNATDHEFTVTFISSNGAFASTDAVVLTFSPTGSNSVVILSNNTTPQTTAANPYAALMTYTIPANQLATNGDVIELTALFDTSATTEIKDVVLYLGGSLAHAKRASFSLYAAEKYLAMDIKITRQSTTTVFIEYQAITTTYTYVRNGGYAFFETAFSVADLSTTPLVVLFKGQNTDSGSETLSQNQLLVQYLNKG